MRFSLSEEVERRHTARCLLAAAWTHLAVARAKYVEPNYRFFHAGLPTVKFRSVKVKHEEVLQLEGLAYSAEVAFRHSGGDDCHVSLLYERLSRPTDAGAALWTSCELMRGWRRAMQK